MPETTYTEYDIPDRAAIEELKKLSEEELDRLIEIKEQEIRDKIK